jgi:hypothetical protein
VLPDLPSQPDRILHLLAMSWEEVGAEASYLDSWHKRCDGWELRILLTSARSTEWAGLYNTSITARTAVADFFL